MPPKNPKHRSTKKNALRIAKKPVASGVHDTVGAMRFFKVTTPAGVRPENLRKVLCGVFGADVRVDPIIETLVQVDPYFSNDLELLREKTIALEFETRKKLLKGAEPVEKVRELLGLRSRQTVHNWIEAGKVLALDDGHRKVLPMWQFDSTTRDRLVPCFKKVLDALDRSPFSAALWFVNPNAHLGNRTPIAVLRSGDPDRVLKEALLADQTP